jgi:ABC-2 type transport system ATP-binding protein
MSTGQRQRVKLASAIAHDPALVLLDEPTDGLDPVQRDDMLALIRRIGTEFGIDIVVSSHHLEEVERICDAVVILDAGRMIRSGTLSELRRGAEGLLVDVDAGHEALLVRLRAEGLEAELAGDTIVVTGEDPFDVVRDAVADLGLGLRRLEPRRRTLEDVYLEASA